MKVRPTCRDDITISRIGDCASGEGMGVVELVKRRWRGPAREGNRPTAFRRRRVLVEPVPDPDRRLLTKPDDPKQKRKDTGTTLRCRSSPAKGSLIPTRVYPPTVRLPSLTCSCSLFVLYEGGNESEAHMTFEGRFWLLVQDDPIDIDHTEVIDLRDGNVFNGRTGEPCGAYTRVHEGIDILFNEEAGEQRVVQFRSFQKTVGNNGAYATVTPPFDVTAEGYSVTYSTVRYEAYLAANPLTGLETEDEVFDYWEGACEAFPEASTYGAALRDGEHIMAMHEQNLGAVA